MQQVVHKGPRIDLTNNRYGRLVVNGYRKCENGYSWSCTCDCGNHVYVLASNLKHGRTKSCGCLRSELIVKRSTTHGQTRSATYQTWRGMISRCYDVGNTAYLWYGAKGVKVCRRWQGRDGFVHFLADMGKRPPGMTIERLRRSCGYFAKNCCWADSKTQARNRSNNRQVTFNKQTRCLAYWAVKYAIPYNTLWARLARGWSVNDALTTPVRLGNYK